MEKTQLINLFFHINIYQSFVYKYNLLQNTEDIEARIPNLLEQKVPTATTVEKVLNGTLYKNSYRQ